MDSTYYHQIRKCRFVYFLIFLLPSFIVGCSTQNNTDAPVTNGWADSSHAGSTYRVSHGETLYSIAWRYGLDYRELIAINHFEPPYHLSAGQRIKIAPDNNDETTTYVSVTQESSSNTEAAMSYNKNSQNSGLAGTAIANPEQNQNTPVNNINAPVTTTALIPQNTENEAIPITADVNEGPVHGWLWPVHGAIINNYTGTTGFNKGIDIAGHIGEPIHATAAGKVVYCGGGLRGYGQLIIIKHNDEYLSAYAHNSKILVREGQVVHGGQVIALMGNSEAQRVMLHFEIRRAGKPVDPLTYLGHA